MTEDAARSRRGRRAGRPDTRTEIVHAALELFARDGFAATSMRAIARAAGCDAALVHHYFSSKEQLFFEALEIWFDVDKAIAFIAQQGRPGLGRRAIAALTNIYETNGSALFANLAAQPEFRAVFVRVISDRIEQVAGNLTSTRTARRRLAAQAEAIIAGFATTRYLLQAGPAAELSNEEAIEIYGDLLQHAIDQATHRGPTLEGRLRS